MKLNLISSSFLLMGALAATDAVFARSQDPKPPPVRPAATEKAAPAQAAQMPGLDQDAGVDQALADLQQKLATKRATDADYEALLAALQSQADATRASDPRAEVRRARLQGYLDGLRERSRSGAPIDPAQLDMLRDEVIDARLERNLNWLEKQALARNATRADYQRVASALKDRAEAAKALAALEAGAATAVPSQMDFDAIRAEVIESRLERALDNLEKISLAKGATRANFSAVRDLLADRAAAAKAIGADAGQVAAYQQALDDLEKRALAGDVTREQFAAARAQLVQRARAASAPVKETPPPQKKD